jgi:exonuclease VII small subunit
MYDPSYKYYEEVNEVLRHCKKSMESAAQKYRTKYELSTMDVADMNKAIDLMNLLVRIYIILNEQQFAQDSKKTIEKWKDKLEQDLKKKDEEKKKSKQVAGAAARVGAAGKAFLKKK